MDRLDGWDDLLVDTRTCALRLTKSCSLKPNANTFDLRPRIIISKSVAFIKKCGKNTHAEAII